MKKRVAIIAYDACWAMSVYLAKDFFRIVSLLETHYQQSQSYQVEILTVDGDMITSSCGAKIIPDAGLSLIPYDVVIIPAVV